MKRFRDSHHKIARLFASGLRPGEVAELAGYSLVRVSVLYADPAFQELLAGYRGIENDIARTRIEQYNDYILANGLKAEAKLADKLDDDDGDLSVRELLSISRDAADRVGLSKRSIQTNINMDFASMLDKAIKRSGKDKVIDLVAVREERRSTVPGIASSEQQPPLKRRL